MAFLLRLVLASALVAGGLAVFPNSCDICCLGRGLCRGLTSSSIPGSCCPYRTRCCLTGAVKQAGAYSCCSGAESCAAVPTVPGEKRCSIPQLLPVAVIEGFDCPVCCLGRGNCASVQQTAGSCCDKGDTCCLQGDIPRMPGAYTCCRQGSVCARSGNDARQCLAVQAVAPVCTKCCLGENGECDNLRTLTGSCCQADESCCLNGDKSKAGAFVCCSSRQEQCVRTESRAGMCVAKDDRPTPSPVSELCQGRLPLEDPVQQTTLSCGVGTRACPGPFSYCDTKHVFPADPYRGVCCPYEPVVRQCARQDDCETCAKRGCVWIQDGDYCHSSCPASYLECVRHSDECPKKVSWVLGSCFRRCGEVGRLRSQLVGSTPSQQRSNTQSASYSGAVGQGFPGTALFGPSQQMTSPLGAPASWVSPFASPFAAPRGQICSCDFLCERVGDCCDDYEQYCLTAAEILG